MKKTISLLLAFLLVLSCAACGGDTAKEAPRASFDGNTAAYTYYFPEEGREHDWEEDILYFAETVLNNQPYMTEWCNTWYYDQGVTSDQRITTLYNEELRNSFLENLNLLIPQVSNLNDTEILWELNRISATLNDVHTNLDCVSNLCFPPLFRLADSGDGIGVYAIELPVGYEEFLFARLDSINDVPIDEILERLKPYVCSDNEYYKAPFIVEEYGDFLTMPDALQIIGVMDWNDTSVEYTFTKQDGTQGSVKFDAITWDDYFALDIVESDFYDTLRFENTGVNYWYKYQPDSDTMYVRIRSCFELEELSYWDFYMQFVNEIKERSGVEKLVIDLRGNSGGRTESEQNALLYLTNHLNQAEIGQTYILIDSLSCSGAVGTAAVLKHYVDGALLVGTPASETPSSILPVPRDGYTLPNHGTFFNVSGLYYNYWYGYEGDALMPDITIHQTIEDYEQGVDTVLDAVLNTEITQ